MKKYKCWHFLPEDKRLRWGTQEVVEEGKTYTAEGSIHMCTNGMHGSEDILDALDYAPGPVICLVEIWGSVQVDSDKLVGRHRKVLKMIRGEETLRLFARMCALHAVKKYWKDAPDVVSKYLETGEENCRSAASAAAKSAGRSAGSVAWSAAWSAEYAARDAAKSAAESAAAYAAGDAAWDAAWSAEYAAGDAAWDAAWSAQSRLLRIMVKKQMGILS